MKLCNKKSGFMLLEAIISIALIVIGFVAVMGVAVVALNVSPFVKNQTQANSLALSQIEALRNFRDGTDWAVNGLGVVSTGSGNPYYFVDNSGSWQLTPGTESIGIFTRKIIFDKVSRDTSGNIEQSYNQANNDPDTIKASITITWQDKSVQNVLYLTNWKND